MERAWRLTGQEATPKEAKILTLEYVSEYRNNPKGGTRAFPGVHEGVRRLVQLGWKLGLCTNKDGRSARALVEELGWSRWIRVVVSGEESLRKPDPSPLRLAFRRLQAPRGRHLFIGDSEVDLQTARNAGVEGVFLGHGYGRWEQTSRTGAKFFREAVGLFSWMSQAGPVRRKG